MGLYSYHVRTRGLYYYHVRTMGLYNYQVRTIGLYCYHVQTYNYHVSARGLYYGPLQLICQQLSFQSHGPYYHVNTLSLYSFHVRRMDQAGRKHGKFHQGGERSAVNESKKMGYKHQKLPKGCLPKKKITQVGKLSLSPLNPLPMRQLVNIQIGNIGKFSFSPSY